MSTYSKCEIWFKIRAKLISKGILDDSINYISDAQKIII